MRGAHIGLTVLGLVIPGLIASLAASLALPASAAALPAYSDDRSTPAGLIGSFYNAINRHEYARAFSYWDPKKIDRSYDAFVAGYADTRTVAVTTGAVETDSGAGNLYYALPVLIVARDSNGTLARFAGCYRFHLSQPSIQDPPFTPLRIVSGRLHTVAAGTEAAPPEHCPVP